MNYYTPNFPEINKKKYKNCLEGEYNVVDNMYMPSSLKQGVACGAKQEVQGAFKSGNPATKLENAIGEASGTIMGNIGLISLIS